MNVHAIRAIYMFEMARTWRTVMQSILAPVMTTSLYFVVFGAAIGSRMAEVDGVKYAAFIIPGLTMLSLLNFTLHVIVLPPLLPFVLISLLTLFLLVLTFHICAL